MKTLVLYLIEANAMFTVDTQINFHYLYLNEQINNCFDVLEERLNKLETADTLFQADLLKKAEQEPKNLEMYMLIEHLAGEIETIQKEIQESRYNKVNIDHLKEQFDAFQKKVNGH
jgi:hypothetical protein